MYYQNPYKRKNNVNKKAKFIKKISFELMGIFIIMLLLMLFKYSNTNITRGINDKVKNFIFADYTEKTTEAFNSIPPYINKLINKNIDSTDDANKDFLIDSLPIVDTITDDFGKRTNPVTKLDEIHTGIDINAKEGTEVKVVADGTVESITETQEYGIAIVIDHGNGFKTKYAHLSAAKVSAGGKVLKGQIIALSGNTGKSTGPHLHFEVIKDGIPVDPVEYLKSDL